MAGARAEKAGIITRVFNRPKQITLRKLDRFLQLERCRRNVSDKAACQSYTEGDRVGDTSTSLTLRRYTMWHQ